MKPQYRLVEFSSDPFTGSAIPVAAIVASEDGRVKTARSRQLPDAECLGGADAVSLLKRVLGYLGHVENFNELPGTFGPHFALGERREVPKDVADPVTWVERFVLPAAVIASDTERRDKHISTKGFEYLRFMGLSSFVKKVFKPDALFGRSHLPNISHYAGNPDNALMLMEPLVLTDGAYNRQVEKIATRFGAYRFQLAQKAILSTELVAYVIPQSYGKMPGGDRSEMERVAHHVYDLGNADEKAAFAVHVRLVAGNTHPKLA